MLANHEESSGFPSKAAAIGCDYNGNTALSSEIACGQGGFFYFILVQLVYVTFSQHQNKDIRTMDLAQVS